MYGNSPALCVQGAVAIEGALERAALMQAIEQVIKRHEALRTAFHALPGMDVPLQVIDEDSVPFMRETDLRCADEQEREAMLLEQMRNERLSPFDYEQGRVMRLHLVRMSQHSSVLIITLSAMSGDAWSIRLLAQEISRSYAEGLKDIESACQVMQYADFSEWQNELLESEEAEAGRDYWLEQNVWAPSCLKLPCEVEPSIVRWREPESVSFMVSAEVLRQVEALAHEHNTTLSVVLLAGWQALLWRLTGLADITVETAFDSRKYDDLRGSVGRFVTHLPISCRFREEVSFSDVVKNADQIKSEADEWQEYFPHAQAWQLNDEEKEKSSPVAFEFEEWPTNDLSAAETTFTIVQLYSCTDYFKLKLRCALADEALRIELQYDRAVYGDEYAGRLATLYETLLEKAVAAPRAPLDSLPLVGGAQRQEMLWDWNETAAEFDEQSCLHELFEAQAERTPEAVAVLFENQQLSYGELNRRANRVAHHLCELGVGPEMMVGVLMERSPEMVVALLGILKAGAAYVPLDPSCPAERLSFILKDTKMPVLLSQRRLAAALPENESVVVCLDSEQETIARAGADNPQRRATSQNLAYVIYTSGSTGLPKGVMVQHRSVVNLSAALNQAVYAGHGSSLRVSVNAPLAFDASIKQIIQLLSGHTLCLIPDEVRVEAEAFLAYVKRHGVEVLDCTPSQMRLLLDAGLLKDADYSPRLALLGGEAIDETLWRALTESRETAFHNVYGPTECTVDATSCRAQSDRPLPSIGAPLANISAYVLDKHLEPVPLGVAGELYIGGACLSRGYLNQPEKTAERFIPHPFSAEPGARLYRTGDVTRRLPDGGLEYLGRTDHQVKIRGHRIELGEIEAVLTEHPSVREAVVVAREDALVDKRLVGYVVPCQREAAKDALARHSLPNGMRVAYLNRAETDYLYEEIFREEVYLKHGIELPDAACVFDVGANIGMFTLFVSQHYPEARVYAFEPVKRIFEALQVNAELYGRNVRLFQFGLAEAEKQATFSFYLNYPARSGLKEFASASDEERVTRQFLRNKQETSDSEMSELAAAADELLKDKFVSEDYECALRRLSDVIREEKVERIDLLKVDVQHAELQVLRGIANDDWDRIQQVAMEVHDAAGQPSDGRLAEIITLLREQGFEVVAEQDQWLKGTDRHNVYAIRQGVQLEGSRTRGTRAGRQQLIPAPSREALDAKVLRKYLKERLPDYMLPASFVLLDELPLTNNGKVDRLTLPEPKETDRGHAALYVCPQNKLEAAIAAVWQKVLGLEKVSVHENFFDLGGHSLLLVQIHRGVKETLKRDLSLVDLFRFPTISSLANYLGEGTVVETASEKIQDRARQRVEAATRQRQFIRERKQS